MKAKERQGHDSEIFQLSAPNDHGGARDEVSVPGEKKFFAKHVESASLGVFFARSFSSKEHSFCVDHSCTASF